jgi:hypothetical protein
LSAIIIIHDGACVDCNQYAADFDSVFSTAKWPTMTPMALGINLKKSPTGLTVVIYDDGNPGQEATLVVKALETASIPFGVVHESKSKQQPMAPPPSNVSLLVTARTVI